MLTVVRVDREQAGGPPEPGNFIGSVRMQNLSAASGAGGVEVFAVFFEPGARTRPHTHPTDQMLVFVEGSGFVVFPGEEEQALEAGQAVAIPRCLLHMHGARDAGSAFHIALRAPGPTDWHPPVPEEWKRWVS
jgi:quercetin dioxygenase-like cupin family protein